MDSLKKKLVISIAGSLLAVGAAVSIYLFSNTRAHSKGPSLVVAETTANLGGEVYVNVDIQENPGISGFVVDLEYDNQLLEPIEVVQGDLISQGLFDTNLEPQVNDGVIKTTWFDVADVKSDGELYAVKFRVIAKKQAKTPIKIQYQEGNIANQSLEDVSLELVNADVKIRK